MIPIDVDLIIYHGNCPDGWCAAFVAQKKYKNAVLMPMLHGYVPALDDISGKSVLVLDFSWPRETTEWVKAVTSSLLIIDHHKTADAALTGLSYAIFDMNRSGAGLTWDTLNPGQARPWYVNYVEDVDLWNNKLPRTKEISAYLKSLDYTVAAWSALDAAVFGDAVNTGRILRMEVDHYVKAMVAMARYDGHIDGHSVGITNAPYLNISELCHAMLASCDIALGWFVRGDGMTQFSLRSAGELDVSAIAKRYGGGGHKNAAGFQLPLAEARKVVDSLTE